MRGPKPKYRITVTPEEEQRVLLNVEADDLRRLHWEQLHAPLDRGWDYLLLNQGTPFSLYLSSQIQLSFPPIGHRDCSRRICRERTGSKSRLCNNRNWTDSSV